MKHWTEKLEKLDACAEAVAWAKGYPSFSDAWNMCGRGDWMLWLIGRQAKTIKARKHLVLAACECARLSLKYLPKNELRPLKAIETAEAWACGSEVTVEEVRTAAYAAYAAANAAAHAADAAAYAAAYAAYAARAATYAANAADAADAANAADAARIKTLKRCAEIVRKYFPSREVLR